MNIRRILSAVALALAIAAPAATLADPPSHAPAHGWRKKNDPYYVGYTGRHWTEDYGVRSGHCDRDQAGAAVGAVVGGAIGKEAHDSDLSTAAGAAAGAYIGRRLQRHAQETHEAERTTTEIVHRCGPPGSRPVN